MKKHSFLTSTLDRFLHDLRMSLSRPEAMVQMAALGLVAGLFSGMVIVAFRIVVEGLQAGLLPGGIEENYEALPVWLRIAFPLCAALLIIVLLKLFAQAQYFYGVVHV